jgi:4-coumarate--CoA ligase
MKGGHLPSEVLSCTDSLQEYILKKCDSYSPDLVAIVDGSSGRSYKYGQLRAITRKVATGLSLAGFNKGDVMAIFAPNLPEYLFVYLAVLMLGGILTTANPTYTAQELHHQLQDSEATHIFTLSMFSAKVDEAMKDLPKAIKKVFLFDEFAQLLNNDGSFDPTTIVIDSKSTPAVLPYSSGTTGLAKGVILTHFNIIVNLNQSLPFIWEQQSSVLAVLPFFHIYGQVVILFGCLLTASKIVSVPKFDPASFAEVMIKHEVSILPLAPPLVNFLLKSPLTAKELPHLKEIFSGAASLGEGPAALVVQKFNNVSLRQGYGMTEMSPVSHITPKGVRKYGSIGKIVLGTECVVAIVDDGNGGGAGAKGFVTKPGERGELWVRGPQVMKGYWKNAKATAETIDADGFLHTGDIVTFDEDGMFYVVDRLKELIKVKGFQVAPAELEAKLLQHDTVIADAAVIPIPDERSGELPCAYVVLRKDVVATETDIINWAAEGMSEFKRIGKVIFTDVIPKSASGKILRKDLRAKYAAANAQ